MRSALVGARDEVIDPAKSLDLKSAKRTTFNSGGGILPARSCAEQAPTGSSAPTLSPPVTTTAFQKCARRSCSQ